MFLAYEGADGFQIVASDVHGTWRNNVSFKAARMKRGPSGVVLDYERWNQARSRPARKVLPLVNVADLQEIKRLLGGKIGEVVVEVCNEGLQVLGERIEAVEVASVWISVASQYLSMKNAGVRVA